MDSEQAREIMERNEAFLKATVYQFMRKCSERNRTGVVSREDLMQEVSFCFLAEVERYGEEAARAHKLTLFHAMYQAVMGAYPLSVPRRSGTFKTITDKHLWVEPWEAMADKIKTSDTTNRILDRLELRGWLNALSDTDKQIIRWRLEGVSQREIGQRLGLTSVQTCRRMKRIKAKLMMKS